MDKIINDGIKFLASSQQKDGSFLSLTSSRRNNFKNATDCESVFSTALILSCLNTLENSEGNILGNIKKRTARFLLSQKSEHWSFNYWARGSSQSKTMPYPDDLDDTACAMAALFEYDEGLIGGEALAGVVTTLTVLESKEGGPYRTWLVPPSAEKVWQDIDLAVNSNIGYFLSLQDVTLKNIVKLIESAIDNKNYTSPYYPSVYPVIYFMSRFYRGKKRGKVIEFLLERQKNNNWGNQLDTALVVLALLNLGFSGDKLKSSVEYIAQSQEKDGSWKTCTFYTGINPRQSQGDKNKYYAGSSALTTAFCIAAIHKVFPDTILKNRQVRADLKNEKAGDEIYKEVIRRAKQMFSILDTDLKKQALQCLKKTITGDKNKEIVLLPYFFALSLKQKLAARDRSKIIDLGLANLYGWMAYTMYDDFLDEEGDPQLLPVANVALREAYNVFLNSLPGTEFTDFVKNVFCRIDSANAWEVANCRVKEKTIASALAHSIPNFSDIKNLSDRSLGHVLGPIGILCALGYDIDSRECQVVLEGFRQYIAARQIHDDMHDWEEDLFRGQINSASAVLLSMIKNKNLAPKDEADKLQFLQNKFWEETVVVLCDRAFAHLAQARSLFLSAGVSQSFVDSLLSRLYSSTELTLRERKEAKKFIAKYSKGK